MSEFRRRLLAKKGEFKTNEILAIYDVVTTEGETVLLGADFNISQIVGMNIDGNNITPTKNYIFNGVGEHVVKLKVSAPININFMFSRSRLKKIDLSKTIILNCYQTFLNCSALVEITMGDTSSITSMYQVFRGCTSLTSVPLFDTSKVTTMYQVFYNCSKLTSVPLFNTSNVKDFTNAFGGCSSLTSVPLFDTSSTTNMYYTFSGCSKLTSIPQFDTSKVTNFSYMFQNCIRLTSVPLFDTANGTNFTAMLYGCSALKSIPQFNTSNATTMQAMCRNCSSLTSIPLLDATKVTNIQNYFINAKKIETIGGFINLKVNIDISSSSVLSPLSVHNIIEQALGGFAITLHATAKTKWQNSEYFEADKAMATEKLITIQ